MCVVASWPSKTGGDLVPEDIRYIRNVMTTRSEDDFVYHEVEQEGAYWEDNVGWGGIIDNEEGLYPGLRREDPGLEYNSDFEIWWPTSVGWDFEMTYKPLRREDVGTTWLQK